jgi:hypothetical protein
MPPKKMPTSSTGGQMKLNFGSKPKMQGKLSFGQSKKPELESKKRPIEEITSS